MQPFYIAIYSNPHNIKFTHNMYGGGEREVDSLGRCSILYKKSEE